MTSPLDRRVGASRAAGYGFAGTRLRRAVRSGHDLGQAEAPEGLRARRDRTADRTVGWRCMRVRVRVYLGDDEKF